LDAIQSQDSNCALQPTSMHCSTVPARPQKLGES
jgi:hypothetical protein